MLAATRTDTTKCWKQGDKINTVLSTGDMLKSLNAGSN